MKLHKNRHQISHRSVTSLGYLVSNLLKEVGVTESPAGTELTVTNRTQGDFEDYEKRSNEVTYHHRNFGAGCCSSNGTAKPRNGYYQSATRKAGPT